VAEIGIRQLRSDLAASVRRAAAGEALDVSIGGRAVARLGPLGGHAAPATGAASLISSGALIAPRRNDGRIADGTVVVWRNVRLDRLLREVRG